MTTFGGFGGFGANNNNNNQQKPSFGGFGSTSNTTGTGFGSTGTTGFGGTSSTVGGLFGSSNNANNNNATTGGFGTGGFGQAQQSSGFGAGGGFGSNTATSGAGLFGSNTATAGSSGGFGGFGNTASTTTPFGGTGGGLFGTTNKTPAFGSSTTTATPFGGTGTTTGFGGGGGASTGFGAPASTALSTNTAECNGTGAVPFQPTIEKEPNSQSNQQNSFQSISFQPAYQKFSPEELRLADYVQGRRFGNNSGQAGAFGQNTNFGGFGTNTGNTTTGGLFGANNATTNSTSTPFGQSSTNTAGGMFGQKSAATGGLFGATNPAQPSGGMFGANTSFGGNNNTNTGFGGSTGTTGGGLFGQQNNNNNQQKTGFSFGSNPTTTGAGFGAATAPTGFGQTGATSGGLFGNSNNQQAPTTGAFGQTQPQQPAGNSFGGFGQANTQQQPPATGAFGGFGQANNQQQQQSTGGLFGSSQAKPGGLFGSAQANSTGTGLFGAATTGSSTENSGGLFGQAKPQTTTGGLFGNASSNPAGGGLFGNLNTQQNQQPQQQNTSSLFGNNNNQQQANKPSLFGQTQPNGGSLFGNQNINQQNGSSLFSSMNNQTQQQQQPSNSLFGGSTMQGNQQQNQQPQSLTASINDPSAFGTSMFSSLGGTEVQNPGPIATPLSSKPKARKAAALPMYRLSPASAQRFVTPQKRGFGFTYSTYGSPSSVSSSLSGSPQPFGNSLLGASLNTRLTKSFSSSSLRTSFGSSLSPSDSILAPGAFSASPSARHYGSTGSLKKLVINRNLRNDLFSPPSKENGSSSSSTSQNSILKKRVSFDSSTIGGNGNSTNGNASSSPLKSVTSAAPSAEELGFMRSKRNTNTSSSPPEAEQTRGKELAIVPEENSSAPAAPSSKPTTSRHADQVVGKYWMRPSREEVMDMNRTQRSKISGLVVGREGVGEIRFDAPVDMNGINLEDLFGKTVSFNIRVATVYPEDSKKPPMGKGLNVPATIVLQNSWPRAKDRVTPLSDKSGPLFNRHLERLQRVKDTHFVSYDSDTGVWTFSVDHFTTYGFEYEEGEGPNETDESGVSSPPETLAPASQITQSQSGEDSFASNSAMSTTTDSGLEDTFDFKRKKVLPGAFDEEGAIYEGESDDQEMEEVQQPTQQSFLDERSVGSLSEDDGVAEPMEQDDDYPGNELVSYEDREMAGSFPQPDDTTEQSEEDLPEDFQATEPETPGAIMRARMRAMRTSGSPLKRRFNVDTDDWTDMLSRSVSPKKRDRLRLKVLLEDPYQHQAAEEADEVPVTKNRVVSDGRGFATSIDLMNSLFSPSKSQAPKSVLKPTKKGFEWPYAKKMRQNLNGEDMSAEERQFHESMKPSWGPDGTLVYSTTPKPDTFGLSSRKRREKEGLLVVRSSGIISETRDVRFAKFSNESTEKALEGQLQNSIIELKDEVPCAKLKDDFTFNSFIPASKKEHITSDQEKLIWRLASILFDRISDAEQHSDDPNAQARIRKSNLSKFWVSIVSKASTTNATMSKTGEEAAIAYLTAGKVADACASLVKSGNYRLATLVAMIGSKDSAKKGIREQLNEWQKSKVLSEFSQPIRALYEILAGNVCVCDGAKGQPIEDRMESFIISKRFGLDWRQAFGLRLWYAILPSDDIKEAVGKYAEDLKQDRETAKPMSWYIEQGLPTLWKDRDVSHREDMLWGLLKLYSFPDADLDSILEPENARLSPLDMRLSWQLAQTLTASGHGNFASSASAAITTTAASDSKRDALSVSFAAQLVNEGLFLDAAFVLLHLSSADARLRALQAHLSRHAHLIGEPTGETFVTLTDTLRIPAAWLWQAKALYQRAVVGDPAAETRFLLSARLFAEAHRTFAREVAPMAVVERDYDKLRGLLDGFIAGGGSDGGDDEEDNNSRRRGFNVRIAVPDWHLGGEVYGDFLALREFRAGRAHLDGGVVERLLAALPAMMDKGRAPGFLEGVAVGEIGETVAKTVVEMGKEGGNRTILPKLLRLPLTEDRVLKQAMDLSVGYYRAVCVGDLM